MKQNIKNNHIKKIDAKLYSAKYYDFMLLKGNTKIRNLTNNCIADFSDLNINNNILFSNTTWSEAVNKGVELNNIGLTGMDNGLISFRKDRITNEEFLNLFINSKYTIEPNDTRLFLSPITGNTLMYSYPMSLIENQERYISFKGGFYQGFFKTKNCEYQVLPDKITNNWLLSFEIRPRHDYKTEINTINYNHPNNEGIFFFIGTRAENKFWPFYKINEKILKNFKKINANTDGYFNEKISNNIISYENNWLLTEIEKNKADEYFNSEDGYLSSDENINNPNKKCENYFDDNYINNNCPEINNNKAFEENYIGEGLLIDETLIKDSEGHNINEKGYVEIETDNKFLLFDRTPNGVTTNSWVEGSKMKLIGKKNWSNANYFTIMNQTKTGYTTNTIDLYNKNNEKEFNIYKDISDNVFALRITKNGEIGYRYGMLDCENENNYSLIEEYSKPNIIKPNEWNNILVKFNLISSNKMKILIYVNSYLIFVSKEINTFNFRKLDEVNEKQETVPYNISLGGGTLGLVETILPNYYNISDYILPIEKDFCGSFLGDIKDFKIYIN